MLEIACASIGPIFSFWISDIAKALCFGFEILAIFITIEKQKWNRKTLVFLNLPRNCSLRKLGQFA